MFDAKAQSAPFEGAPMTTRFSLPARLDLPAAGPLANDLLEHVGTHLELDASEVTHITTPGAQVLLAAARSWQSSQHRLAIHEPSTAMTDQLQIMGLSTADISHAPDTE